MVQWGFGDWCERAAGQVFLTFWTLVTKGSRRIAFDGREDATTGRVPSHRIVPKGGLLHENHLELTRIAGHLLEGLSPEMDPRNGKTKTTHRRIEA